MTDLFAPPHNGTPTSRDAALLIRPSAATLRERVYDYIASRKDLGATDDETQAALSMEGSTERPRRQELQLTGRIIATAIVRKTRSGRTAVVWVAHPFAAA